MYTIRLKYTDSSVDFGNPRYTKEQNSINFIWKCVGKFFCPLIPKLFLRPWSIYFYRIHYFYNCVFEKGDFPGHGLLSELKTS